MRVKGTNGVFQDTEKYEVSLKDCLDFKLSTSEAKYSLEFFKNSVSENWL